MSDRAANFRLKLFINANPITLQEEFNAWAEGDVMTVHGNPSVQFTSALQKFVLAVLYTAKKAEEVEDGRSEQV